jgi:glucose-6-phosphate 1-dehydrogenase
MVRQSQLLTNKELAKRSASRFSTGLGEAKLNAKPARVVMEKPLGTSLETSREINDQVGEYFEECQVAASRSS